LWASVRTIAFVAAMLGVGSVSTASEASAVSSTVRGSTVRTVAVVSGSVLGFAQDDRYLAWLLPGPREPDLAEGSVGVVAVQNLGTGVRTRLPVHPEGFGCAFSPPQGLALAGDRAYWQQTCWTQNTLDADLVSASVQDRKVRGLGYGSEAISRPQSDPLLSPVSDGTHVYSWTGLDDDYLGSIVRTEGLSKARVSGPVPPPAALAAGGGRFALALGHQGPDQLAWSPDGKWIAYSRGERELWLMKADGTDAHRIATLGISPSWSPDGTKLAYEGGAGLDFGEGAGKIVIANADGSDPRVVTSGYDPAWSPDGGELGYAYREGISVVGVDGLNNRVVIPDGYAPAWSPDGGRLAFVKSSGLGPSSIMVANADGSDARTLVKSDVYADNLSWSPDGSEIAFTGEGGCSRDRSTRTVCEIHPDGSDELPLRPDLQAAYSPAWGPKPGQLLFVQAIVNRVSGVGATSTVLSSRLVLWPGMRTLATVSPTPILVSTSAGRQVAWIDPGGAVRALAVSSRVVAAIVHEPNGGWAIEVYQPRRRLVRLVGRPQDQLAVSGTKLVFQVGRAIEVLDASSGSPTHVATATSPAIGLSIVDGRIAWAEDFDRRTRVRTLQVH
jgi:TolB protein